MSLLQNRLKQKQAFISFGRGFSILAIVLYHILAVTIMPGYLSRLNKLGGAGIYFFLFASGYGLYTSSIKSFQGFFKKRLVKVILPYYLGITLIFSINILSHSYTDGWKEYLSHIFFFKMFSDKYIYSFGYHFWFISTIVQFYVLCPLLIYFVKTRTWTDVVFTSLIISIGYSVIITLAHYSESGVFQRFVLQYLWVLVLGMTVAKNNLLQKLLEYPWWIYFMCAVVSLAIAAVIELYAAIGLLNDVFMFAGFTSISILAYILSNSISAIQRFVLWIESFSYSLYILHIFVLVLYMKTFSVTNISFYELPPVLAIILICSIGFNNITGSIISSLIKTETIYYDGALVSKNSQVLNSDSATQKEKII